jgi:mycothiol synthase
MNQPFAVRPAADHDARQLSEFLNACTLVHQGIARSSPEDMRARIHRSGADPALDSFVVRDDQRILGFAHAWLDDPDEVKFFARTHPEEQGRGIGGLLVQLCEARAAQLPATRITTTTWAADAAAPPLLVGHSFWPVRCFIKMQIAAADVPCEPSWPPDVNRSTLAAYSAAATTLYQAWSEAFAGHWGQADESEVEFWNERRDSKTGAAFPFDPTLWLVALRDGNVIGFCLCEAGTSEGTLIGRVSEVGVVPAHRGGGLGYALLVAGLHELRSRGAETIVLDVDAGNETSAVRLYEKAGMSAQPAFTIWEKSTG